MFSHKKTILIQLIGIVIFIIILFKINISESIKNIFNININLALLAIMLMFPIILIKAFRWRGILFQQQIKDFSLLDSFLIYFVGIFWSFITPGRLGDFVKTVYLQKKKCSFGKSLYSVLLDRLFDIFSLIILGVVGMFLFFKIFQSVLFYLGIVFLILGFGIIIYLFKKHYFDKVLNKIIYFLIPSKYRGKFNINFSDFKNSLRTISSISFINSFLLSLLAWAIYFLQIYFLAKALSIPINFVYISICTAIVSFLSLIPITVSGIGTRDLVLIALFSELGISKERAIALSLLTLLLFIVNGFWGWLAGFFRPLKINPKKHPLEESKTDTN